MHQTDSFSVTRIRECFQDYNGYLGQIEEALACPWTGYPLHADIQTIGDLRKVDLFSRFPDLGKRPLNWLLKQLDGSPNP